MNKLKAKKNKGCLAVIHEVTQIFPSFIRNGDHAFSGLGDPDEVRIEFFIYAYDLLFPIFLCGVRLHGAGGCGGGESGAGEGWRSGGFPGAGGGGAGEGSSEDDCGGAAFFEKMAADNHFGLDFTDDTSKINTVNLKRYTVFVMLQLAPFDMSPSQQAALQQFVEEGKGWVGIHAAGLTGRELLAPASEYREWFEDFMGGVLYSPHPAFQTATVHVDDPYHPLMAHMPSRVSWPDEWYEWNSNLRGRVHVLASVGDHPVIWTNERYRRMVYIGPGHDPGLLKDSAYARLLRDAILWAASGDRLPPITLKNGVVDYGGSYDLPGSPTVGEGFERVRMVIERAGLPLTVTKMERDTIGGTAMFKVMTGEPVKWFWMRFDWTVTVTAGRYVFHSLHYYEKPVGPGVSNEFSKIEYRWGGLSGGSSVVDGGPAVVPGDRQCQPGVHGEASARS